MLEGLVLYVKLFFFWGSNRAFSYTGRERTGASCCVVLNSFHKVVRVEYPRYKKICSLWNKIPYSMEVTVVIISQSWLLSAAKFLLGLRNLHLRMLLSCKRKPGTHTQNANQVCRALSCQVFAFLFTLSTDVFLVFVCGGCWDTQYSR